MLVEAFECTPVDDAPYASIRWNARELRFTLAAPGSRTMDALLAQEAVVRGFLRWAGPECTDLRFSFGGVVPEGAEAATDNSVVFLDRDWAPRDAAAVGLTTMTYRTQTGLIEFGRMELNEQFFRFADAELGCEDDGATYDLEAVVTHEVGHFIGLAHPVSADLQGVEALPTMTAAVAVCDPAFRSLEADDEQGLCFVYPSGEPARQCPALPAQPEPLVGNRAFGCSSTEGRDGLGSALLWLFGLFVSARCFWRRRPKPACSPLRGG